jgi:leucyl aminopeptidase
MLPQLSLKHRSAATGHVALLVKELKEIPSGMLNSSELEYIRNRWKDKSKEVISMNQLDRLVYICRVTKGRSVSTIAEKWRKKGEGLLAGLSEHKASQVTLLDTGNYPVELLAMAEGLVLGNYQFLKYRKDAAEKESGLKKVLLVSPKLRKSDVDELQIVCEAVYRGRDLVNEPLSALNATELAEAFQKMGKEAGIKVDILNKKKIESLKMGGLLAVNRGSIDPPTFTIMEYKPEKPVNKKPLVLVGKGIVYDTGGLSLKPSASMDTMKCDMAGSATVACALFAIAKAKLPLHVIALAPATDNRPDGNAYVPGDIISMMDGTTVEVLNTDAEGRLILADALTFAKRYDPMLVIDVATLTGAAQVAIGKYGMVGMQAKAARYLELLKEAGLAVHERIAEFPFWDDYAELLKSEFADLKNIGGPHGGAITAGKFLQHFTDYPYIHLDIAGVAFLDKKDSYRPAGGTATGVRLLVEFGKMLAKKGK